MSGKTKNKGSSGKKTATRGKSAVKQYAAKGLKKADRSFHIKLKHVLGGISLLSLLAAFEVFSIPAGSGIIDFLDLARISAALVWFGVAISAGFIALILHKEEMQ